MAMTNEQLEAVSKLLHRVYESGNENKDAKNAWDLCVNLYNDIVERSEFNERLVDAIKKNTVERDKLKEEVEYVCDKLEEADNEIKAKDMQVRVVNKRADDFQTKSRMHIRALSDRDNTISALREALQKAEHEISALKDEIVDNSRKDSPSSFDRYGAFTRRRGS